MTNTVIFRRYSAACVGGSAEWAVTTTRVSTSDDLHLPHKIMTLCIRFVSYLTQNTVVPDQSVNAVLENNH
jgi:hypothetical protein